MRNSRFTTVYDFMFADKNLDSKAKLIIFAYIYNVCATNEKANKIVVGTGFNDIARFTRFGTGNISKAIKQLVDIGYIFDANRVKENEKGKQKRYVVSSTYEPKLLNMMGSDEPKVDATYEPKVHSTYEPKLVTTYEPEVQYDESTISFNISNIADEDEKELDKQFSEIEKYYPKNKITKKDKFVFRDYCKDYDVKYKECFGAIWLYCKEKKKTHCPEEKYYQFANLFSKHEDELKEFIKSAREEIKRNEESKKLQREKQERINELLNNGFKELTDICIKNNFEIDADAKELFRKEMTKYYGSHEPSEEKIKERIEKVCETIQYKEIVNCEVIDYLSLTEALGFIKKGGFYS